MFRRHPQQPCREPISTTGRAAAHAEGPARPTYLGGQVVQRGVRSGLQVRGQLVQVRAHLAAAHNHEAKPPCPNPRIRGPLVLSDHSTAATPELSRQGLHCQWRPRLSCNPVTGQSSRNTSVPQVTHLTRLPQHAQVCYPVPIGARYVPMHTHPTLAPRHGKGEASIAWWVGWPLGRLQDAPHPAPPPARAAPISPLLWDMIRPVAGCAGGPLRTAAGAHHVQHHLQRAQLERRLLVLRGLALLGRLHRGHQVRHRLAHARRAQRAVPRRQPPLQLLDERDLRARARVRPPAPAAGTAPWPADSAGARQERAHGPALSNR